MKKRRINPVFINDSDKQQSSRGSSPATFTPSQFMMAELVVEDAESS